ncbi:hypothetical protein [Ensifer aridi]|uniref:hypothetical protein n=1 Tax=Ensifer aridi TaxID=1708715 RepID=UPI000A103444|nr:hypothetical protein [Ensifer aridi]
MQHEDIPAPPEPQTYRPDQITLYGVGLNVENRAAYLPLHGNRLKLSVVPFGSDVPELPKNMPIAVIYGYAYEGYCYRFDKPKLFVFSPNITEAPAKGCGYDNSGYVMWQITKKTQMLELSTSADLAEELVLNANLPGNRSPNTYGNSMALAHRSGRLTRGGGTQG